MVINVNFQKQKHYSPIRNTFQRKHRHHIETSQPIRLENQFANWLVSIWYKLLPKGISEQVFFNFYK